MTENISYKLSWDVTKRQVTIIRENDYVGLHKCTNLF